MCEIKINVCYFSKISGKMVKSGILPLRLSIEKKLKKVCYSIKVIPQERFLIKNAHDNYIFKYVYYILLNRFGKYQSIIYHSFIRIYTTLSLAYSGLPLPISLSIKKHCSTDADAMSIIERYTQPTTKPINPDTKQRIKGDSILYW